MTGVGLPENIRLLAFVNGQAVPHALFEVQLPMRRKNSYNLVVGPADDAGRLDLAGSDLEAKARDQNDIFPMDYVGLAHGWTGEIRIRPVAIHDLNRLREGFATWGETGLFPDDYVEQLDRLEQVLSAWAASARLTIDAAVQPEGIVDVEVIEQPVNASESDQ